MKLWQQQITITESQAIDLGQEHIDYSGQAFLWVLNPSQQMTANTRTNKKKQLEMTRLLGSAKTTENNKKYSQLQKTSL